MTDAPKEGGFEFGAGFTPGEVSGGLGLGPLEEQYEELFAEALEDGVITAEERARLEKAADNLGLDRSRLLRLEQAMVAGRRWSVADFEAYLVGHPLLGVVIRGLVWGAYGPQGAPRPFQVTEARTYVDAKQQPVKLGQDTVGLVHPLQLADDERARWLSLWDSRGLLCPFPQLEREVTRFAPEALVGQRFTHACGGLIPHRTLRGQLLGQGWIRGEPQDAGLVAEHVKHFPAADLTAVLQHGGLSVVPYDFEEAQPVEGVLFLRGRYDPAACAWLPPNAGIPLREVDPTVLSEVARDLVRIDGKRVDG